MNEREAAEMYQRRKRDAEMWGESQRAKPRRRLAAMVSVRFSPEEGQRLRAAADLAGMSLSGFVRAAALGKMGTGPRAVKIADYGDPAYRIRTGTASVRFDGETTIGSGVVISVGNAARSIDRSFAS